MADNIHFSQNLSVFHGLHLPEDDALLAGYAAIIYSYDLKVPLPETLAAISKKHRKYQTIDWVMFTPRHTPHDSLYGHLTFALKHEGVNLSVLKALFDKVEPSAIVNIVNSEPTGSYSRRIWFLYEWLQGIQIALPPAMKGKLVDALDSILQYPGPTSPSKRHRVNNNLPGVPAFCPTIRRTVKLEHFIEMNLNKKAQTALGAVHPDVLTRAAAFMLLKDSKASFAIEGETPPHTRAERWGQAIGQSGTHELSHDEFVRLQQIIISDFRFTQLGYRNEGGFIGEHERTTGRPIPDHISARWQDLFTLLDGLIATNDLLKNSDMNAILVAAVIAFGFVFIHPYEDGNGRVHRYLIHHVLAEKQFTTTNIVFPISAVILNRMADYRKSLESYSKPRLKFVKWRPTEKGNVEVLNETIDLYRYFDATRQAEFLYECIQETIEVTLPEEVTYLKNYDEMKIFIKNYVDMPDRMADLLIRFLNQENGVISNRAKRKEFSALKEDEIKTLEKKYYEIFLLK